MLRAFRNFIQERNKYTDLVLYSSFLYLFSAILIGEKDVVLTTFLFLVFLTSLFYHSYPRNVYFRLADWLASLSFVYYLVILIIKHQQELALLFGLFLLLIILATLGFVVSLIANYEKDKLAYNLSHSLWHLTSSILILLIFFWR